MAVKHVYVTTTGPLSVLDKSYTVGWEDVYLRLHDRRRTLYLAPMIESHLSLKSTTELLEKAGLNRDFERSVLARIDAGERFVADETPRTGQWRLPNIWIAAPDLGRKEAEEACVWYLAQIGYRNLSFRWKPHRGYMCHPVL
jgi:hypothetical protein